MSGRYARQIKLAEVGALGQERIAQATGTVHGQGPSAAVEARYLAGAGFGKLVVGDERVARAARDVDPAVDVVIAVDDPTAVADGHAFDELVPAARDVALGAYRALAQIRALVLR